MFKRATAENGLSVRRRLTRAIATVTAVCATGLGAAVVTASAASAADSGTGSDAVPASASAPSSPDSQTAEAFFSLFPTCPDRQVSTPFAPWGDDNFYAAVAGGSFEDGGSDWTLSGATIVPDNETFHVDGADDTQSLSLTGDAQATSPDTCVDLGNHSIRMFVKSSGDPDSTLHIQASVEDPLTGLVLSTGFDVRGGAGTSEWSPTDQILIPNLLGGLLETDRLSLVFTTTGSATWNVDDVYLDPFKSH
jgi:hypothetical protein